MFFWVSRLKAAICGFSQIELFSEVLLSARHIMNRSSARRPEKQ
jgi:hypothetical protein